MAAIQIDGSPFLAALRKVIATLPFNDHDRGVLLFAVEECTRKRHNALDAIATRKRPVTPEKRLRRNAYMRAYRARQKEKQS